MDDVDTSMAALRKLYEAIDTSAATGAKHLKATCSKGCASCCYLLAMASVADGVLVAHHLLKKPDWPALLPKLALAVRATLGEDGRGMATDVYFHKWTACVFLDEATRECTIYDVRPTPCRTHFVVSPPADCAPAPLGGRRVVGAIDNRRLEMAAWDASLKLYPVPMGGPIPLMVIAGLSLVLEARGDAEGLKQVHAVVMEHRLPTPRGWTDGWHEMDKGMARIREERGY